MKLELNHEELKLLYDIVSTHNMCDLTKETPIANKNLEEHLAEKLVIEIQKRRNNK